MKRIGLLAIACSVFCILVSTPSVSTAELHLGFYMGAAFPQDLDVTARSSATVDTTTKTFDPAFTLGARFGYWFESVDWLGVALDGSLFIAEAGNVDLQVVPVSLLLTLRYPKGKFQPYFGIGPSLFWSNIDIDLGTDTGSESGYDLGIDSRVGLEVKLERELGIFLEYRYTYFDSDLKDTRTVGGTTAEVAVDSTVSVHYLVLGFAYHF